MKYVADLPRELLEGINTLILDVDGVLTDGRIIYSSAGDEIKAFHVRDGSGLKYWHRAGHSSAFLTGRSSPAVERRATELGVAVVEQNAKKKLPALAAILAALDVRPQACAYVGDDLPDIPVMQAVGLGVAVCDAAADVKDAAAGVTHSLGGCGAAREVIEAILRAQGHWARIVAQYRDQRMEG